MDVYQWTLAARQDLDSYLAVSATSLPYNLAHAVGNFLFCLLIGPAFVRALRRYRSRLEVRWSPAPASVACALLALALVGGAPAGPAEAAQDAADRAARYLQRAQNGDGGFGAAPGQRSSDLYSGWAGLGLAAGGRNPQDVRRRGGRSLTSYLQRRGRSLRDIGEVERTILLLKAAGLSPRDFGGRDLVARVERARRGDGSIGGYVSYTAFGVLALRAGGRAGRAGRMLSWLVRSQNADGGFGVARSSPSDSDMTGAALQVLAVTGRRRQRRRERAVAHLRGSQNGDGGFGQMRGAARTRSPRPTPSRGWWPSGTARGAVRRALAYLAGLQRGDGSIAYADGSAQTPVWVTAQALMALRRAPLPLATVPRRRSAGGAARSARAGARVARRSGGRPPPATEAGRRRNPARPAPGPPPDAGRRTGEEASVRPLPRRPEPTPAEGPPG